MALALLTVLTACGGGKEQKITADPAAGGTATAKAAEIETPDDSAKAENNESAEALKELRENAASDTTVAAEEGLRDLYAMETYDTVPEDMLERHDDVDYGTIDEDV
jgi:hypothetical protein